MFFSSCFGEMICTIGAAGLVDARYGLGRHTMHRTIHVYAAFRSAVEQTMALLTWRHKVNCSDVIIGELAFGVFIRAEA